MQVLNALSAVTRAVDAKVGWNRIALATSILIIGAAAITLLRLLRDIEPDKVLGALAGTTVPELLLAGLLVAAGYVAMSFYDFFALRTIGHRQVPYRVAALASFTSYSIGHNLGATVLTGGMVRLRIYSAWGLCVVDVAKIAFVTGLTFWLGNAFILGLSVAYAPEGRCRPRSIAALARPHDRADRAGEHRGLSPLVVAGASGRGLRRLADRASECRAHFRPDRHRNLDLTIGALAMYVLLPPSPPVDFVALLAVFVLATLIGFLSHAPGSLGVFDAALLIGLAQFDTNELVASLLLFRVLYFILPFLAALCLLGARELRPSLTRSARGRPPSG